MTPAALVLARDADSTATQAATTLWAAIIGEVDADAAGAALDSVSAHVGSTTDVPDATLQEAVIRTGAYLDNSRARIGLAGVSVAGIEVGVVPLGSALRRSGAQSLLMPWTPRRAGKI